MVVNHYIEENTHINTLTENLKDYKMLKIGISFVLGLFIWMPILSWASDSGNYTIVIKNHQFEPAQLNIPAGQKIKLIVDNQDATAEEFESFVLNREKIVSGNK